MSDHEAILKEIPAYATGRLTGDSLRDLEHHLKGCGICSEMVATWKEIAAAVNEEGQSLLGPHPDVAELRAYARGQTGPEARSVARHLESCPACELEVEAWKVCDSAPGTLGARPAGDARAGARPGRLGGVAALSAIAGVVVGAGLMIVLRPAASIPPAPILPHPTPSPPAAAPPLSGPVPLHVLPAPLRGENDLPVVRVPQEARIVLIAIQPAIPGGAPDGGIIVIRVEGPGGGPVWESSITAREARAQIAASGVVTLAVPVSALSDGEHEVFVHAESAGPGRAILQIPFAVKR